MSFVPESFLKQVYRAGSLQNTPAGVQFALKNTLARATVTQIEEITFDQTPCDLGQVTFSFPDGSSLVAGQISPDNPLTFKINQQVTVAVAGTKLGAGSHEITIGLKTREYGGFRFTVTDSLA
ncbi:MAG: hypothetical protein IMW99_06615 [Firmicutes bacterium]|nr:hypothetical protein [Bacillota bacterium]